MTVAEASAGRLIVAVAAAGPLRTARLGAFAAVLNAFVLSLIAALWSRNPAAWNGRAGIGLAILGLGGLAVTAPALLAWARATFTRTLIVADDRAVAVRTRWSLPGLRGRGGTVRWKRTPSDHAAADRRGAWWSAGGPLRTVTVFVWREAVPVAAALVPAEERFLVDVLNARLLAGDAAETIRRSTYGPEVRAVLRGGRQVLAPLDPADLPAGLPVTVARDGAGRVTIRTPAAERGADRVVSSVVLLVAGAVGGCLAALLFAAGLAGGLPLWVQLGLAALPVALFTAVPVVSGLWTGLGRVTVTIGAPESDPFAPVGAGETGLRLVARWHVGPFGVTWRAAAGEVRGVWISHTPLAPDVRPLGGEPRYVAALTAHEALPLTSDALRPATRDAVAGLAVWALGEVRSAKSEVRSQK